MKIETPIPSKTLLNWLLANTDKVEYVGYVPGFVHEVTGNDCSAYDIMLTDAYHFPDWYGPHRMCIERKATEALSILKQVERCTPDCTEHKANWKNP